MENTKGKLCQYAKQISTNEGTGVTQIPYITFFRYAQRDIPLPDLENPYIYLIINGDLRLHSVEGIRDYTSWQYFFSSIDSPVTGQALSVSSETPFLALAIECSVDDVASVMLDIDGNLPEKLFDSDLTLETPSFMDARILETILRLLTMTPLELSFMGKHLKREIIFDLIMGPCGKQFMQGIVNIQQTGDIYHINSWIKENYKIDFSVEDLAEQSNMSLSSFHQKFKSAVGMGPLQCQKKLRLTEARRLMLDKAANVTDAAMEVGYESVSQFIRDYRRMFGRTPQKDVQEIYDRIYSKQQSE